MPSAGDVPHGRVSAAAMVPAVAAILLIAVATLVIAAWIFDWPQVEHVLPHARTMKLNTALCLDLIGVALWWLRGDRVREPFGFLARTAAAIAATVSLLTLIEYVFAVNLHIDAALVADPASLALGLPPGRMSAATGVGLAALSLSLLIIDRRRWGALTSQLLTVAAGTVGAVALAGYLFGAPALYAIPGFGSVAIHTALLITAAALGILLARPGRGLMAPILSERLGGMLARRLLPAAILIVIGTHLLIIRGSRSGLYEVPSRSTLEVSSSIALLVLVIWLTARTLNRLDGERESAARANALTAAVVESSQDAIIAKDPQGLITGWNPGAERLFGYSAAQMLGRAAAILVPEEQRHRQDVALARVHSGLVVEPFDTVRLRSDGRQIEVAVGLSPIRDAAGRVVGTSQVIRDIRPRLAAEERFRRAVEAAPSAMILADARGQIVFANSQAERMFGYAEAALVGLSVDLLVPARIRERHVTVREGYVKSPQPRFMGAGRDLFALRKDGTEFPVEIGLSPLRGAGEGLVLASVIDISDRKRAEESIKRQKDELSRSNRDLEQFAYVASHDLQEPLRAVAGCVQLLQRRYGQQLDAGAKELIAHAVAGADRMRALIDDLLSYSRVGRNENPLQVVYCEVQVERALRNLSVAIRESGAVVRHETMPCVLGSSSQLTLVFQNLISNAIKFRREGVPPEIAIGAERRDRECIISVRDNGIGIAAGSCDRIFSIFQRLHTRQEYPGTGIGLALVKRIVERHGGRIWVQSEPGTGSVFRFTLRLAEVAEGADSDE